MIIRTTLALLLLTYPAAAASTAVTVRAVSRDAKILGDGVGGARITIREVDTGRVLATGLQEGNTGETKRIMQEPRARGAVVYDTEGAAAFRATFDLRAPTRVELIAEGPLKYPQAMQRVSKTMLLVPGQTIEGEGVLLEIPGFIVDVVPTDSPLVIRAKVTMSCGCPTEPGGLWDAENIIVTARATRDGKVAGEVLLRYAGEPSTYEASLKSLAPGAYDMEILAVDRVTENAGRFIHRIEMQP